jgi:dihydrofolate reductase
VAKTRIETAGSNLAAGRCRIGTTLGRSILTDGSSQLVHTLLARDLVDELHLLLYPLTLGSGKRLLPSGVHSTFALRSTTPYPTGVVGLHYARQRG